MNAVPACDVSGSTFEIEIDVGRRALRLVGDVDVATSPCVLAAARAFLAEFAGDLTLDLRGVTFADSALRSAIIQLRADAEAGDTRLMLVNHSAAIKRLFLAGGAVELLRAEPAL